MKINRHFVYFIQSLANNRIYVGYTGKNLAIRVGEHNRGANAWTKLNKPFKLLFYEEYTCEQCARSREKFYKSGLGRQIKTAILDKIKQIKPK